jgi:mannose-1-phosphate guanylyltransferase
MIFSPVFTRSRTQKTRWCIVVADDHGPEWAPATRIGEPPSPVQYSRLGESSTLLQRALQRATRIAAPSRVMLTALDEYREYWEPSVRFITPERRFVCGNRAASLLTGAAALLSIAAASPSSVVTVLPARCYVFQEWILSAAIELGLLRLPSVAEGVVTLGMVDANDGIDEDYLLAGRSPTGPGLVVRGFARRPTSWVARHLREQGAMIASGIMIGYAGAFAAHISKHWPGLTLKLLNLINTASSAGMECEVPMELPRGVPKPAMKSLLWQPPSFTQRAFCVRGCGWSGLKSAHAVARVSAFLATAALSDSPLQTADAEYV